MSDKQKLLESYFEKYKGKTIPGTEYWDALVDFADDCFKEFTESKDPKVGILHSFIAAAYHYGREQGEKYKQWLDKEIEKLDKED